MNERERIEAYAQKIRDELRPGSPVEIVVLACTPDDCDYPECKGYRVEALDRPWVLR